MSTTTTVYALVKHARGDTPWDVEVNADLDTIDAEIARPRLPFNSPTVGATTTCDLALARTFVFTVTQATTLAFTNVPTSSWYTRIWLRITNGGAFALTFPVSVKWLSTGTVAVVPQWLTAGVDTVELETWDGGTTWYATSHRVSDTYWTNAAGATIAAVNTTTGSRALQSRIGNTTTTAVPVGIPIAVGTDLTTTASGAGSPANLKSFASGADTLNAIGQGFRVRAWGTSANNANAKTVRIAVGATQILSQTLQVSVVDHWMVELCVYRTGATTADAIAQGQTNGTSADSVQFIAVAGLADWTTTGNTIQVSCTQTSAADVTQEGQMVEWLGL